MNKVITRFPPSPTGYLHIGRARTALFNYLFAKQQGGKFILRIEDTDTARSKKEYEEDIVNNIKWLGLSWDEGPIRQSDRISIYKKYLKKIVEEGKAYLSEEKEKTKDGRSEVIRFKNPNIKIKFRDIIRGDIEFDTGDLGDFVIAKSLDEPLYHMAVVIDDFEMGVTHVIRGEDGISNTPRQMLIQEAIGAPKPIYAHIPLILDSDRSKLSGRHGAVSLKDYRDEGYLPEALINYMALLGWNSGTDKEIWTLEELVGAFDIKKVQKGGAIFNIDKLKWVNRQHIQKLPKNIILEEIKKRITDLPSMTKEKPEENAKEKLEENTEEKIQKIIPLIMERISTWGDISLMDKAGDLEYYFQPPKFETLFETSKLLWKDEKDALKTAERLKETANKLDSLDEKSFTKEEVKDALWNYAEGEGRGKVLWPMRYALSGRDASPDPFTLASILGKRETLNRLKKAGDMLLESSNEQ